MNQEKTPIIQYPNSDEHMGENESRMVDWAQSNDTGENTLPVFVSWQLNERMYGDLQGLNKQETREKFGNEQVHIWRRSYDVPPPNGESLELTAIANNTLFGINNKKKSLKEGKNVFVAAHGNSLRSIVMSIENLSKEDVLNLEIPTGKPIVYEWDQGIWQKGDSPVVSLLA